MRSARSPIIGLFTAIALLLHSAETNAADAACLKTALDVVRGKARTAKYNPTGEKDNCVACTAAFLHNGFSRIMAHTAESLERAHGAAGIDQEFTLSDALQYVQTATNSTASARPVAFMDPKAPSGMYALFYGNGESYTHVVAGWIMPNGRKMIYDAQSGTVTEIKSAKDWDGVKRRYRAIGARPYLFTPNSSK